MNTSPVENAANIEPRRLRGAAALLLGVLALAGCAQKPEGIPPLDDPRSNSTTEPNSSGYEPP